VIVDSPAVEPFATHPILDLNTARYIDVYYNSERMHAMLDNMSLLEEAFSMNSPLVVLLRSESVFLNLSLVRYERRRCSLKDAKQ
jgi:hypothetical protein